METEQTAEDTVTYDKAGLSMAVGERIPNKDPRNANKEPRVSVRKDSFD